MAKHTIASVAGSVAVLRKETDLQDERITKCEETSTLLLVAMGRVETAIKKNGKQKPDAKTITIRRLVESAIAMTVVVIILATVVLIFAGRLTAEDIANILRAWKGDG